MFQIGSQSSIIDTENLFPQVAHLLPNMPLAFSDTTGITGCFWQNHFHSVGPTGHQTVDIKMYFNTSLAIFPSLQKSLTNL